MRENCTRDNKKRILILSNACFSDSDSNGRTLRQLFRGYSTENIAQFFVYGQPDYRACHQYYQVTDSDAMYSFFYRQEYGKVLVQQENRVSKTDKVAVSNDTSATKYKDDKKKIRKTPFSMLAREVVWKFGKWDGRRLWAWINQIKPDIVFLSLADNIFLPRLAIQIVQRYGALLYVYSTESYCFKNYNYLTKRPSLFYSIFHSRLKRIYKRLEPYVKLGIFNTPLLTEMYAKYYRYPCKYVFSPSSIDFIENYQLTGEPRISYLGNLGVGRHEALVELADVLGRLFPGIKLDIYGKLPENEEAKAKILGCANIEYRGFVAYQEVVRIIHESTLLVHAELDDEFYSKDLKYAFSTKIADSVCSGTPLLIYARRDLAETDFLVRNDCAFVASDREELERVLKMALTDIQERKGIIKNAEMVRKICFSGKEGLKELIEK